MEATVGLRLGEGGRPTIQEALKQRIELPLDHRWASVATSEDTAAGLRVAIRVERGCKSVNMSRD